MIVPIIHARPIEDTPTSPPPAILNPRQAAAATLPEWCAQAETVAVKLRELVRPMAAEYLERIYTSYTFSRRKDNIRAEITAVSHLQKAIYQCQANILQAAGVGTEWERAEEISKAVVRVVRWLEDILVWAMIDVHELVAKHNRRELMYQSSDS